MSIAAKPCRAAAAIGLILAFWSAAGHAWADPCEARVKGYAPGATVTGTVRYVGDGDSLCIGPGTDPATWIEIRLADLYAPELYAAGGRQAKATLQRLAMGQRVVCTATRGKNGRTYSYDRLLAVCVLRGRSLGDRMRAEEVTEGGRGR